MGMYSPASHANMMAQMGLESNGDPLSYNDWDRNFTGGHPSKSLLQTIPGTFRANAAPGYSTNIWDPLSNAFAALQYVKGKYGGVFPLQAYDSGGYVPEGLSAVWNGTGRPEPVFNGPQWDVLTANAFGGSAPSIQVNNYVDINGMVARTEVMVDGKLAQVARVLTTARAQA
jgi:SLT domain-containing protein